jgi:N-acetylglutamate synthase-like GNAT family acetyltransferase
VIEYKRNIPNINEYWELFESTGWYSQNNLTKNNVEKALSKSSFTVTAYEDNKVIGFARAISDGLFYATIYDVAVLPAYKNKGIGRKLVSNITKQCNDSGIITVNLFAAKGTDSFYSHLGFTARPKDMPGMIYNINKDKL